MRVGVCVLLVLGLMTSAWGSEYWQYTLRPGDTLWNICQRFTQQPQTCWRQLADHNNLNDPHSIQPGQGVQIPVDWLEEKPVPATLHAVRGQVRLYPAAGGDPRVVENGDSVAFGDALETGAGGSARLLFADQSRVVIKPDSFLVVTRYQRFLDRKGEPTELHLERGGIRNRVTPRNDQAPRFKVYTPGAAAAVRGTDYYLRVDGEQTTRNEVIKGQVDVSASGASQEVAGGFATLAEKEQPPLKPMPLLDAPAVEVTTKAQSVSAVWPSQARAQAYWLEVYQTGDDSLVQQQRVTTDHWQTKLPEGQYRLLVRAADSHGLRGHEAWRDLTVRPAPEKKSHWELWVFLGTAAALFAL